MRIEVFTDGSATTANNPGGYGWVLIVGGNKYSEGNGHMEKATNNDAEMEAAIQGLVAAYKLVSSDLISEVDDYEVILCSDSQITLNWANGTYRFKQEAKYAKFEILKKLMAKLNAQTRWVRGHSGNEWNERCDELANLGRLKLGPNDIIPSRQQKKSTSKARKLALTTIENIYTMIENEQSPLILQIKSECEKVLKEVK